MNSYGDPSSARGRAPYGPSGGEEPRDDGYRRSASGGSASYGSAGGATGRASAGGAARASSGRASVRPVSPAGGSASAGRASVPVPGGAGGYGTGGRGSTGRAMPGRASVGSASVGSASVGSASVGSASVGSAAVARASVRPVSPAGYGPGGTGPGGPGGPGFGGRGGRGGDDAARRAKKRKRLNLIIASFAVFIMLSGIGVVGGTYYTANVPVPAEIPMPLSTTIYYAGVKQELAKLGEQNRQFVSIKQIPAHVQAAVVSAEDRKFYKHSGVDYAGIARAAWNNFTGGTRQGASTITQQYARNAMENLKDDTYARKVKEAVIASKLNDKYSKDQIMEHYLNTIFLGRGAYGIEAAAQAYFGRATSQLTVAQAAVLAAVIKQPEPSATHRGYDPHVNPEAAKDRWNYVLDGMVEMGALKPEERPKDYPQVPAPKKGAALTGVNTPVGNVVNYVDDELAEMGICSLRENDGSGKPTCSEALRYGGYRIETSIDPKMQAAAESIARRSVKGSLMSKQKKNLMAAVVSVDPKTGRVLAYYGGDNGSGHDFAGKNTDANGNLTGGHPPGSTFKVYTLAAALEADIALDSHWDATDYQPEGIEGKIRNGQEGKTLSCPNAGKYCSLEHSVLKSYNVPFYKISERIGPDKIVDMARAAGITTMWGDDAKAYDLTKGAGKQFAQTKSGPCQAKSCPFFHQVAFGQYAVTVLDHANGMATIANRGVYNKAHFVVNVWKQNKDTGAWEKQGEEKRKPTQTIRKEVTDDVSAVLKKYPAEVDHTLDGGRQAASKTGTWEYAAKAGENAHAWMVGYTPQLATAVWVGNVDKEQPIREANNDKMYGAGLPGEIWERYMEAALKGKQELAFGEKAGVGDSNTGDGQSPSPKPPTCPDPTNAACPPAGNNPFPGLPGWPGGNGNDNGGGGGGGETVLPSPSFTTRRE